MNIQRAGAGPDLVVVHGWGMHCGVFADVLPALREQFTVHLLDLPGHGANHARERLPPLRRLAEELRQLLPTACWLGWSLGGQLAMTLACRFPARVRRLVVVASTPRWVRSTDWPLGMEDEVFESFATGLASDHEATWQRFLALEVHGSKTARRDLRHLRELNRRWPAPTAQVLSDGLARLRETDLRPDVAQLTVPTLVISGSRDRLVPPAAGDWLAAHLPQARHVLLRGLGHAPFIGDPEAFLSTLVPFLSATEVAHV
ncbi:MAG: pimeloyl-ACP methyl ester esterase BioH [Pseudomonadota bacterium]